MASLLERIYPFMPVPVQSVGISLYGLRYRNERLGGAFHRHVSGFRERQQWSKAAMDEHVTKQLQATLSRAFTLVPYYKRLWASLGISAADLGKMTPTTLSKLPITLKRDLRLAPEEFIAQDIPRRELLRYYTSGTSGTPIQTVCTREAHRSFTAAREARSLNWAGCTLDDSRSMIGGRMVVPTSRSAPPYYRYNFAERQVYFSAYHIRPSTVENYLEGFHRYRPEFMTGYAFSHYLLATLLEERGLRLDYEPRALVMSSEKLTPVMKAAIQRNFRARAYEEYGSVEQVALATECHEGSLHVHPDFGVVELLDVNDNPVGPGVEGRVIATGLLNPAQPLVRYDTGDLAVWSDQACSCERHALPVLKELVGRVEDAVILEDGTEMVRFHGIFVGLPHVMAGQIIQDSPRSIHVKIVPSKGFGKDDEEMIRRRITLERLPNVSVTIETVTDLERTSAGKVRGVISLLPESERQAIRSRRASV